MKPWQIIVIVLVILLLFGAPKLPGLAKSLGQSMRIFRKEVKGLEEDKAADEKATGSAGSSAALGKAESAETETPEATPSKGAEGDTSKSA